MSLQAEIACPHCGKMLRVRAKPAGEDMRKIFADFDKIFAEAQEVFKRHFYPKGANQK